MAPRENEPSREEALRRRVEAALGDAGAPVSEDLAALPPDEAQRMLHELRVHQIELWMQNEELRRVQHELEANRIRYWDLYHHAPVGYCSLDVSGQILEGNLTLARLLGVAQDSLAGRAFAAFIHPEDQDTYYLYGKELTDSGAAGVCEIRLRPENRGVEPSRSAGGGGCEVGRRKEI